MKHLQAVILDWAGTVVDYGSVAPTSIFVEAFARAFDFNVSLAEARVPMGMGKWDHIKALGALPSLNARWQERFGQSMQNHDVDFIYQTFMPLQKAKVAEYAAPIDGALVAIEWMREQGLKIGSCSGYPKEVMDILVNASAALGYKPDAVVASDELAPGSRPGPWMALENVIQLGVNAVWRCVKVDDAAPGIAEGLNAGMWTIGIVKTGNAVGMTQAQWQAQTAEQQRTLLTNGRAELLDAGAHYVVDSLADIPEVLLEINACVARGERP
ncbi:MAG: phosphonoacetaldehyde hydrolase [Shewanella sp.]|jgi:phosphonoacetaldehyde hydrolase